MVVSLIGVSIFVVTMFVQRSSLYTSDIRETLYYKLKLVVDYAAGRFLTTILSCDN